MANGYDKAYYDNYDMGEGGVVSYLECESLRHFMSVVAEKLITDLQPSSMLDAGCAMGILVSEFRKRGVDAYGIDYSDYAVENADPIARPYCIQGSLADPIPQRLDRKFDLITCFEVLEHMSEEDGKKAIKNLCRLSDTIVFCSTPDDYEDPTHINIRQRHYWARCFAECMFFDDLFYRPTYITGYAVCYRRRKQWIDQIDTYEKYIKKQDDYISSELEALRYKEKITSTVFWRMDDEYDEENSEKFVSEVSSHGNTSIAISRDIVIPAGCDRVRIDPCEGYYCSIENVRLIFEGVLLDYSACNGFVIDGMAFFPTEDPQIEAELPPNSYRAVLHIDMRIHLFDVRDMTIDTFKKRIVEDNAQIAKLSSLLENIEREQVICSSIFFPGEDGTFIPDNCKQFNSKVEKGSNEPFRLDIDISIPSGCRQLRIDPCEGQYCIAEDVCFIYSGKQLRCSGCNGFAIGDLFFFPTEDPQFEVELPDANGLTLHINMTLRLFDVRDMTLDTVRRRIEADREEADALSCKLEASLRELDANVKAHEAEVDAMKQLHDTEVDALEEEYLEQINDLKENQAKTVQEIQASYEVQIKEKNKCIAEKDNYIGEVVTLCFDRLHQIEELTKRNSDLQLVNQQLETRCNIAEFNYTTISNAFFWKITEPARAFLDGFKNVARKNDSIYLFLKTIKWTIRFGPKRAKQYKKEYLTEVSRRIASVTWPSEEEKQKQREYVFEKALKISVLVPLYNTPDNFLKEMIESVQGQTYSNWELCLADGSDADHQSVRNLCNKYARKDKRIKYKKLDQNLGISGNTNACIEMAEGEYIALFDHDDILHPSAFYEVMKAICEKDADYVYTDETTFESPDTNHLITTHYKPDFAPDNLLANNYICHLSVFSASLLKKVGGFRSEYDGSQDHDIILRLTEAAQSVVHIPKVLYWWRSHPMSVAQDIGAKEYAVDAAKRAVQDFLWDYKHIKATALSTRAFPTIFQIVYPITKNAKVSIVIPNKDHEDDLRRCIQSIIEKTTYKNYEIVIVENNSSEPGIQRYYSVLKSNPRIKILRYKDQFNYSRINNWAIKQTNGQYIVLLNNDTEVITPNWLENMLMYAQRGDVGAVGAKLYFPDGRIQHAGIVIKLGADRIAGHSHYGVDHDNLGYMGRLCYAQDVSAVTAACLMIKRSKYDEVKGLDEGYVVAFNDVDFCLKLREKGYLNIFTPFAELYHYESASRGSETGEKRQRFEDECNRFRERWKEILETGDPYYNPNFSLDSSTFDPIQTEH